MSDHSFRDGQREGCDGQIRLLIKGFASIMIKFRDEIDPPEIDAVTSYFVVTSELLISQPDKM